MANEIIRKALRIHDARQWQLAKWLGLAESTLCRKLRTELPEDEQREIVSIIKRMSKEDETI